MIASEAVATAFAAKNPIIGQDGKPLPINTFLTGGEWGTDYKIEVHQDLGHEPELVLKTFMAGKHGSSVYAMWLIKETGKRLTIKPPEVLPTLKIIVYKTSISLPHTKPTKKEFWLYPGDSWPHYRAKDKDGRIFNFRVLGSKVDLLKLPPGRYELTQSGPRGHGNWAGPNGLALPVGTQIHYWLCTKHGQGQYPILMDVMKL